MTFKHLPKKGQRGFTLVETLVAVLILVTAIAGPLTIASRGLDSALVAKDQISAFFLAQDAIEYVRYKRDSACLAAGGSSCPSNVWLSTLSDCVSADGSGTCIVDSTENNPSGGTLMCSLSGCPPLRYDSSLARYTYAAGGSITPSIFTRTVSIQNPYGGSTNCAPAGSCEALLVVTVSWSDVGGTVHTITTKENLFNWE